MNGAGVNNIALLVGDETGVRYRFARGVMTDNRNIAIASASKLPAGLTIWRLIEAGRLTPGTAPQSLLSFWATSTADPRSRVTLDTLLGFTSGFSGDDVDAGCIGDASLSLAACVQQIHAKGLQTAPDTTYDYGPAHLQIAAAMVEAREGKRFETVMRETLLTPLGLTTETRYPLLGGDNTRIAGSMRSTAAEYGRILQGLLAGTLVRDRAAYLADRIGSRTIAYRPPATFVNNIDWHYGAGFWRVCNKPVYDAACDANPVISSPGAFGFTPWVDFGKGYWAIIAMEEPIGVGVDPSRSGVTLQIQLQPLIEAALARN
jgi:D-alanyl-D-alanine-carboxypeptidase/D-alanyl-D-alanine-endopeptidase